MLKGARRHNLINNSDDRVLLTLTIRERIQYIAFFRNSHPDDTTPRIPFITYGEVEKIPASKPTFNNGISSRAGQRSLIVESLETFSLFLFIAYPSSLMQYR